VSRRLSAGVAADLPPQIEPLRYDRRRVAAGVAHIGVGAFHRAHQLDYFDDLLAAGAMDWGVRGISLRSPTAETALVPQDSLYVLARRGREGESLALRGALMAVQTASEDVRVILRTLAEPQIGLVTLTLTEKAYVPETDDFASQAAPTTAIGYLTLALALRRAMDLEPFTVISCDNLSGNGDRTQALVMAAADALDSRLASWIDQRGAFPNSMVDRITPAATEADRARLIADTGIDDRALTITEPFRQWVIEDRFAGARPPLDEVGVQFVDDVAPWEAAKLRLLNAAHSSMAWLGLPIGFEFVHEAIACPPLRAFVERLWDEAAETLPRTGGPDLAAYRRDLLDRFDNPGLPHSLQQIAADSSRKLPPRILEPLAERLGRGLPSPAQTLAVAAWIVLQRGGDEAGAAIEFVDPGAADLRSALAGTASAEAMVGRALAASDIFPAALANDAGFARALTDQLGLVLTNGMRSVLA
jgi:fructuronate reductase